MFECIHKIILLIKMLLTKAVNKCYPVRLIIVCIDVRDIWEYCMGVGITFF